MVQASIENRARTVWRSGSASASVTGPEGLEGPGVQCAGPAGQPGSAPGPTSPAAPPPGSPACHATHTQAEDTCADSTPTYLTLLTLK